MDAAAARTHIETMARRLATDRRYAEELEARLAATAELLDDLDHAGDLLAADEMNTARINTIRRRYGIAMEHLREAGFSLRLAAANAKQLDGSI